MAIILQFSIFLLGLAIGSFLNVLADRLPKGQGILGRSKCDHCKKVLSWRDLVPFFSFLWQKGRCRYCGKKISIQYPAVELITGMLFLIIFNFSACGGPRLESGQIPISNVQILDSIFKIPNIFVICYVLYVTCILIVVFLSDLKYFIIPDQIIYAGIVGALVWLGAAALFFDQALTLVGARGEILISGFSTYPTQVGVARTIFFYLLSALLAGGFFLFLVLVTRGKGMGLGDVKLAVFMGLVLGWPKIILALFLAFLFGALIGLGLVAARRKTLKSEIPFGTFLSACTLFTLFFGDKILGIIF